MIRFFFFLRPTHPPKQAHKIFAALDSDHGAQIAKDDTADKGQYLAKRIGELGKRDSQQRGNDQSQSQTDYPGHHFLDRDIPYNAYRRCCRFDCQPGSDQPADHSAEQGQRNNVSERVEVGEWIFSLGDDDASLPPDNCENNKSNKSKNAVEGHKKNTSYLDVFSYETPLGVRQFQKRVEQMNEEDEGMDKYNRQS